MVEYIEFIKLKIKNSKIYLYFLDHDGLILTIRVTKTKPKGKGLGKLIHLSVNMKVWKQVLQNFRKIGNNWVEEKYRYKSINLWWEAGKTSFKMFAIQFSTIRKQNINKQNQKLTQAILNENMKQNADENKIHSS